MELFNRNDLIIAILGITAFGLGIISISAFAVWMGDILLLLPRSMRKIKRAIWNRGLKLFWNQLWIRRDEFHKSLDIDWEAIADLKGEKREAYYNDLAKRRHLAHMRDLERFYKRHKKNSINPSQ